MALYKGAVLRASPLRIQLTAPSTGRLHVVGFSAMGENSFGATSRPILTRPSVPGTGRGTAIPMRPTGPDEGARDVPALGQVVTVFRTAPSTPRVQVGFYNLPIRIKWEVPRAQAIIVGAEESILLYALTNGDHTWQGEILWEE